MSKQIQQFFEKTSKLYVKCEKLVSILMQCRFSPVSLRLIGTVRAVTALLLKASLLQTHSLLMGLCRLHKSPNL